MNQAISRLGAAIGCVLVTIALTPLAKADEWDKKTVITTRQVCALRTWFYPGDNSGLEFSIR